MTAGERPLDVALSDSREHYRFFFEQIADGVWRAEVDPPMPVDADPEEQVWWCAQSARLVECNEAMLRMYACREPEEQGGTRLADSFDLHDARSAEFFHPF